MRIISLARAVQKTEAITLFQYSFIYFKRPVLFGCRLSCWFLLLPQSMASFSVVLFAGTGILFQVSAIQNREEIKRTQSAGRFITPSVDTVPPGSGFLLLLCHSFSLIVVLQPQAHLSANICLLPSAQIR
jgi:hypothetical protein